MPPKKKKGGKKSKSKDKSSTVSLGITAAEALPPVSTQKTRTTSDHINDHMLNTIASSSFASFSSSNNKQRGSLVMDAEDALDIAGDHNILTYPTNLSLIFHL